MRGSSQCGIFPTVVVDCAEVVEWDGYMTVVTDIPAGFSFSLRILDFHICILAIA